MNLKLQFLLIVFVLVECNARMDEFYRWKTVPFTNLPPEATDPTNINNYVPENNVPMSAAYHHSKGRLFVTVPRRRYGVPATLNYIDVNDHSSGDLEGPPLSPYPDFETNNLTLTANPDRLTSVYRLKIDSCNRLWFIDTGVMEFAVNPVKVQQPSIWVIDLETNRRIRRFEIPNVPLGNGMTSLTVDVPPGRCDDAFAYIPDIKRYVMTVYSFRQDKVWVFSHNYFSFDPVLGDFNLQGIKFRWNDGLFSIALGPMQPDGFRVAYFHPMVSTNEFAVSTRVLQNETSSKRANADDFVYLGNRGPNRQCNIHALDLKSGVMIYSEMGRSGFGCWNTNVPFSPYAHDSIGQNDETMFYPADLTIDSNSVIWTITNRIPKWIYGSLDFTDYNFRVFRTPVETAVSGTRCEAGAMNDRIVFGHDHNHGHSQTGYGHHGHGNHGHGNRNRY